MSDRREYLLFFPRRPISLRRYLVHLNRSADQISAAVNDNSSYGELFHQHSISQRDIGLCDVEVATLYLEDRIFFYHHGFDIRSIPRTLRRLFAGKRIGGISTIDQQVVRMIVRRYERTLGRKITETLLAMFVSIRVSKRQIFDYYLHFAYMGYKLEGCEVASRHIFGVGAAELRGEEAAFLASLYALPLPRSVADYLLTNATFVDRSVNDAIVEVSHLAPIWSSRIRWRWVQALQFQDFQPIRR